MNKLINVFYGRFVKIFSLVPNEFIDGGINYDSAYNFGFGRRCVLTYSIGECLGRKKKFWFPLDHVDQQLSLIFCLEFTDDFYGERKY